jgi:hypothetical protein
LDPLDEDVVEIDLESELVFTLDLESNPPVEEPLEDAVDDFVRGGTAVCLGNTLSEDIDEAVLTEVFESVGCTDWLPCAEIVRDPLDDAVVLRERVKVVEPVCCIVETIEPVPLTDPVGIAEDDLEFNADRESV